MLNWRTEPPPTAGLPLTWRDFLPKSSSLEQDLAKFLSSVESQVECSGTAAIMVARRYGWPGEYLTGDTPVLVHVRSGDVLRVYFAFEGPRVADLCLETVVRFLFRGVLHADLVARALGGAGGT